MQEISIEELLNSYSELKRNKQVIANIDVNFFFYFMDRLIKEVEDSIPKETIQKYLENEKELFETYKKESKTNENLKMGLYKHMGAKNMCERILGIEKTVTLD